MKNTFPLRSLLGLTQNDMAQLLGIGRSQWAMFETGKRDLPTPAKLLLAEMMHSAQQGRTTKRTELPSHHAQMEQYVGKLLNKNKFCRLSIERQRDAETKKQDAYEARLQVDQTLTDKPLQKSAAWLVLVKGLSTKAVVKDVKGVPALLRYEFQLELLEVERRHLEASQAKFQAMQENPTQ